jgi:hypothetical protein
MTGGPWHNTGRFLRPTSADDVIFGNTFDRPLKLPWGSSAALKFMQYVSYPRLQFPFSIPFHGSQADMFCSFSVSVSLTRHWNMTSLRAQNHGHYHLSFRRCHTSPTNACHWLCLLLSHLDRRRPHPRLQSLSLVHMPCNRQSTQSSAIPRLGRPFRRRSRFLMIRRSCTSR